MGSALSNRGVIRTRAGVVQQPWWRPDGEVLADADHNRGYGGVARKGPQ